MFAATLLAASTSSAAVVAITSGSFYTSDLANQLTAAGNTVTLVSNYAAATLAGYDAVVTYGNADYFNGSELLSYVQAGGILVSTPWIGQNSYLPSELELFTGNVGISFNETNPGITALDAGNALLSGVSLPGAGGFNVGRVSYQNFASGVDQIANWADGSPFLASKAVGAGQSIGIDVHVITSDTAYQVINQAWAARLFHNAVNFGNATELPEPGTLALFGVAIAGMGAARRRRAVRAS